MSLINDALKKAQKQRTGETPSLASMPGIGGESPHRIAKRAKPAGFDTLIVRAGAGAGIVLVLAIGGFFLFRDKPATGGPVSAPAVPSGLSAIGPATAEALAQEGGPSASPTPQVSSPAIGQATAGGLRSQVSEPPPAAPAFTLPVARVPAPNVGSPLAAGPSPVAGVADPGLPATARSQVSAPPASVVPAPTGSDLRVSPFSAPAQTSAQPAASDPQASGLRSQVSASPTAKLEPRAIQFIENIKVGAIMARTSADAKVLMNDRVYRVGSLVEAEMGLTLVGITTGSLTFEDERGARYTRTF